MNSDVLTADENLSITLLQWLQKRNVSYGAAGHVLDGAKIILQQIIDEEL